MDSIALAPDLSSHLDFFQDFSRLPRKPFCTDDLEAGLQIRAIKTALKRKYIQINPPGFRFWSVYDVDRPLAALAWCHPAHPLPIPTWISRNKINGHAHLAWGLKFPVLLDSEKARIGPIRYLAAIESAYKEVLQADRNYSGLITKNPSHSHWDSSSGEPQLYTLQQLAACVDIRRHIPKVGGRVTSGTPVGLGRNCDLFDSLRFWSYSAVRRAKKEMDAAGWREECLKMASQMNDFADPLPIREVQSIAASVSKWTWGRYGSEKRSATALSEAEAVVLSQVQSALGKLSGAARRSLSDDKRAAAAALSSQGKSTRQIAAELGVNQSTVSRWLR